MRILFASHLSPHDPVAGRIMLATLAKLRAAGHDARALTVCGDPTLSDVPYVRRVLCHPEYRAAPIHFVAPSFNGRIDGRPSFAQLTDRQLSDYRDVLRIEFDREIDLYDPHVVHTQQLWLFSHLALEAGVPYAVSTTGEELELGRNDARYRRYLVEAAENAGRVLTHTDAAHAAVLELVGDLEGRIIRRPLPDVDAAASEAWWWQPLPAMYRETFVERFGQEPR
jgi:hypothetical protein